MGRDVTYRNRTLAQRHNTRNTLETDARREHKKTSRANSAPAGLTSLKSTSQTQSKRLEKLGPSKMPIPSATQPKPWWIYFGRVQQSLALAGRSETGWTGARGARLGRKPS